MINTAVIMGRLTADPELRQTQSGISVARFSVAVERPYSKDGERQTDFLDVVAWRNTADFVCRYFVKGQMIAIFGSIQARTYTDRDGNRRKSVEIVADGVSFCGDKPERKAQTYDAEPVSAEPAKPQEKPEPRYQQQSMDDFVDVPVSDDDLPF